MDFVKLALEGKPFEGVFVFDVHGHVGTLSRQALTNYDADGLAHTMDRLGVDGLCVSAHTAITGFWREGNRETMDACLKHPGKIYGYAVPTAFDPSYDLQPYFDANCGFVGVKIHGMWQNDTPEDAPCYDPAFELANRMGLPVLFHAWEPDEVLRAAEVARKYPNCNVIIGHGGLTAPETAVEVCKKYDNIYCDTAISSICDGAVEWLVDKIGADRVLYGSDIAYFDCAHTLGKLALANLSDTDKEKIFGLNAKALFKL